MSIKSKLYAGFGFLVFVAVALAAFAITQFNGIKANVATLNTLADGLAASWISKGFLKPCGAALRPWRAAGHTCCAC